jgi:hypothetical protein
VASQDPAVFRSADLDGDVRPVLERLRVSFTPRMRDANTTAAFTVYVCDKKKIRGCDGVRPTPGGWSGWSAPSTTSPGTP